MRNKGAKEIHMSSFAIGKSIASLVLFPLITVSTIFPAIAAASTDNSSSSGFSEQYTSLTKQILLRGIELERFSLNYRLENVKQPKLRKLRFFMGQEAAAGCGLAFEIIGDQQFGVGRKKPLELNTLAVKRGLNTVMTGSIIGASSSALELSTNILHSCKMRQKGFDTTSATKYVEEKLSAIDQLLSSRDNLIQTYRSDPAYERAMCEGKVLHQMRNAFLNEYAMFNKDIAKYRSFQNSFFLLNIAYNSIGAVAAGISKKALTEPKLNGPANILFIVSGGLATVSPMLSVATSKLIAHHAEKSLEKRLKQKVDFDPIAFTAACNEMKSASTDVQGTLIPSLPATERFALYTESNTRFQKQLENETRVVRRFEKVTIQTSLIGPVIGGLLTTQGILGTYGYYKFGTSRVPQVRKQLNSFYRGAVVGTVGTGINVVGNAAWLLGSYAYEHRLAKQHRLPQQLIEERMKHLNEMETIVSQL